MTLMDIIDAFCKNEDCIYGIAKPQDKCVIVLGFSYFKKFNFELDEKEMEERGEFSYIAIGRDYHLILREKLERLVKLLLAKQQFSYRISVDTGPHEERDLAVLAGLGTYGLNNNILNEQLGSMFNIGLIYTDLDLPQSSPAKHLCTFCGACVKACEKLCSPRPAALAYKEGNFSFTKENCVSFLTQKKGTLTASEKKIIGKKLYGCDECRKVCQFNQDLKHYQIVDNIDDAFPKLSDIFSLDKKTFDEKYKDRAFHWRGLEVLQRNADI